MLCPRGRESVPGAHRLLAPVCYSYILPPDDTLRTAFFTAGFRINVSESPGLCASWNPALFDLRPLGRQPLAGYPWNPALFDLRKSQRLAQGLPCAGGTPLRNEVM